ncbi:PREDICTED: cytosolic acyl coenzyme A thioester hydrolase isoform X1 [Calidris pugnax]|uniref:cytosolic acyl coenzyme A thioester hydrolase isoform X1 n=1 Tax=Calidris pugnax TaxID=198806 RepID=UPI00071C43C9|nr:PREDICTED: cytosolic acyl coenzyme A thioester hydrolase isoform X1 [Calidris pugnax]
MAAVLKRALVWAGARELPRCHGASPSRLRSGLCRPGSWVECWHVAGSVSSRRGGVPARCRTGRPGGGATPPPPSAAGGSSGRFPPALAGSGVQAVPVTLVASAWIMRPDDANIAGNVHGGTILKMIEEAGAIISTRHCNSQAGEPCVAALARVERTDFLSPMCIGEVANVSAEITYTSRHSVEVQVNVMSENILTGAKKVTNKATLWYVPLSLKNVNKVVEVPPIQYARKEQEDEGKKRYEEQKLDRLETKQRNGDVIFPVINPDRQTKEPHTVGYSQSSLIHLVGPSDCTLLGFVHGGVTMKLMDEVAGIVAARHCKTNIVTASVDAINFHEKIKKGSVITISGRMTFTSNKSMEIEVFVDADPFVDESRGRYRAVSAFFTYVSLSKEGKPLPVPQLLTETEDEKRRFEEGKGRYLQTKAKRQAQMQQAAQH